MAIDHWCNENKCLRIYSHIKTEINKQEKEMNLKIYHNVKDEQKNNDVYLRLSEGTDGIYLIACDEKGKRLYNGDLIRINKNGIQLCRFISESFGFNLNNDGQLKIID
jgi:hypothetical protein